MQDDDPRLLDELERVKDLPREDQIRLLARLIRELHAEEDEEEKADWPELVE